MSKKDGGSASNLTMRDAFAMAVLQGFIANSATPDMAPSDCAKHCFKMADVMLAEREKQ